MSTIKSKSNTAIQTQLIKSQTWGLWISISFSILISIISLSVSVSTYHAGEKEACLITIKPNEENYEPYFMWQNRFDSIKNEKYIIVHMALKFDAQIINISKNPITLVGYGKYYSFVGDQETPISDRSFQNFKMKQKRKEYENSSSLFNEPIILQPGETFNHTFNHHVRCDQRIFSISKKYKTNYMYDIMYHAYKSNIDLFGNQLTIDTTKEGRIYGIGMTIKRSNHIPDYYILSTAKGSIFIKDILWYNKNKIDIPFSDILANPNKF